VDRLLKTARALEWINEHVGRLAWWLALALVLVQITVVVLRYLFGTSFIQLQETVIYLYAALFMLGAGYTWLYDGHVRVDIFYGEASPRRQALVDLIGVLVCVLPFCLLVIWISWPFVRRSWAILEGPLYYGGLPAVFLLKTLIPVFAGLLLLQAVAIVIRAVLVLAGRDVPLFDRRVRDGAA
jgi:TRAP-type mannitol/chloroaromatic compound transport system permease small subunit